MNHVYKAIVFDYGGVIELNYHGGNILQITADHLDISLEDFKQIYFQHNHLSNSENMPWAEMFRMVVSRFDDSEVTWEKVDKIIREWESQLVVNTELVESFPVLRARGYSIAIFSNYTSGLRNKLDKQGILGKVDEVVVSAEIGYQKPSVEAFSAMFARLEVLPAETVFIDDSPKSLEKANEIGYTPILYSNNGQLLGEFERLGVI
jgi:putative hydrolase of the HAD superfamily